MLVPQHALERHEEAVECMENLIK
eukprot:COSAG03_NODE_12030_length_565_cov_0.989270_1_plen_23_part_01